MKVNFTATLVSASARTSQKGNSYLAFTFVDEGGDTLNCMSRNINLLNGLDRFKPYEVTADLSLGKYSHLNVESVQLSK